MNSFGCNAVLWSAQGAGTSDTMAWLLESGSDFRLVNSNGHGALHKAAQRGCSGTIKWLVESLLLVGTSADASLFIGPDQEGHCPSDLCGMEGHESLAKWISKQECDYFIRAICTKYGGDRFDYDCIPPWLQKDIHQAQTEYKAFQINDVSNQWGAGFGIRRIALTLLGLVGDTVEPSSNGVTIEPINDLNDID